MHAFTKKDVCKYLQVSSRTVAGLVASGQLTPHHLGPRTVRFDPDEVRALVTAGRRDETQAS